jgi:hypothetical protein
VLSSKYNLNYHLKKDEIGRACSMRGGETRNAYRVLVRNLEEMKPLGRHRSMLEYNIKMDLRGM